MYRETHVLLEDLAEAVAEGTRKQFMESVATVPLLIIGDLGMRKLPATTVEDWGKLLGDAAAATAMLDRILHHGHVLKCGPRSWRTKLAAGAEKWAIENEKVFL
jgi:DNA replication protein DnaC